MNVQKHSRKYNMPDATLIQMADTLLLCINRDYLEFEKKGFNAEKQLEFKNILDNFSNFPSNQQLTGMKMTTTENRYACRENLRRCLRTISTLAKSAFDEGAIKLKDFGNLNTSNQIDDELMRNTKIVEKAARKYFSDLEKEGLQLVHIDNLVEARKALDIAMCEQLMANNNRAIVAEGRVEAANLLYQLIVKYSAIGKEIWYHTNKAKYDNYILYESSYIPVKKRKQMDIAKKENAEATKESAEDSGK